MTRADRPVRVGTWNVNGLASACRHGLRQALIDFPVDVLLLQDLRVDQPTAAALLGASPGCLSVRPGAATRPGGVAVLTATPHEASIRRAGDDALDDEGRFLAVRVDGVEFWSCYAPSGARRGGRLALKQTYLHRLVELAARTADVPVILGGDLNVAHLACDIEAVGRPPRAVPGCLPAERAELDRLAELGWADLVRSSRPAAPGPFTWRSRTRGWRLDHLWANRAAGVRNTFDVEALFGAPLSDHRMLRLALS